MEQLVNTANELIAVIVNYAAFFIIYGAIFYFIGAVIYQVLRAVVNRFLPTWKHWYTTIALIVLLSHIRSLHGSSD